MKDSTFGKIALGAGIAAIFIGSFAPIPALACGEDDFSTKTVSGIHYTIRDCHFGRAARVDYPISKGIKHVTIPRYVKHKGHKIPVNQVKAKAFKGCNHIRSFAIRAHIPWRNFGKSCFAFDSDHCKWNVCAWTQKQLDHYM